MHLNYCRASQNAENPLTSQTTPEVYINSKVYFLSTVKVLFLNFNLRQGGFDRLTY